MRHPDPSDLLDHRRGELPEDQAREIEFHLELCDECRSEWESFDGLEQRLGAWAPEDTRGGAAATVLRRLDREGTLPHDGSEAGTGHRTGSHRMPRWVRQLAVAAAAVAVSLIFQAMVWNPLGEPVPFSAIVSLTSPAWAMTSPEAVPDTVLVLTLHHDETFSTPVMPGRHEVEDLINGLIKSLFFGATIGLIACYKGFTCRAGAGGVGRACTEAFVTSFIAILMLDFFIAFTLKELYEAVWGFKSVL